MKKTIAVVLVLIMLLSITACRDNEATTSDDVSSIITETDSNLENSESDDSSLDDISSDDSITSDMTTNLGTPDISDTQPEIEDTTVEVDVNDKAYVKNPAPLSYPMKSSFDKESDALRNKVLNAKDSLPSTVTGKIWYISNSGSDKNSGNSKNDAWGSINALNYYGDRIKAGDAVLFERGGVFRGTFYTKSNVYYGAYGSGDKPCIYGSIQNYTKVNWKKKFGNIWICDTYIPNDVGTIVFNHGEMVGYKRDKKYEMQQNGDFWCEGNGAVTLYLYMDKNPAEAFKSIEIGIRESIISVDNSSKNVTIDNLCIKYTGAHAITVGGNVQNIVIKNCEIGFIGGSYLKDYWREYTRYGNGIQFWGGCDNVLVENNWIYQIYDSGLTHQGDGSYVAKNLTFKANLVEYCGMGSYEYWMSYNEGENNYMENITISDNIMRFAGYCWGGLQRFDKERSGHIVSDVTCHNDIKSFKIINNIFDQSTNDLIDIGSKLNIYNFTFNGNIYSQAYGGLLGTYAEKENVLFDESAQDIIKDFLKDTTAKITYY